MYKKVHCGQIKSCLYISFYSFASDIMNFKRYICDFDLFQFWLCVKAVEYIQTPSNGLRRGSHHNNNSHHHQTKNRPEKTHFHVSAPDFHGAGHGFEMRRHSSHHR